MPKPKPISKQRIKTIRTYVKQGYSSNKIQKKLQKQHMGMRRKALLSEIRKIKGHKPKANSYKYTPKKYRRMPREVSLLRRARKPVFSGKRIAFYQSAKTKRHPKPYSARFEFYGSGKDQYKAVRLAFSGIVPRKEWAFVECSARQFVNNPYYFGEKGVWLGRPNVES